MHFALGAARVPAGHFAAITEAIAAGEQRHGGQVMFAVEADLPLAALWHKVTPRQAAEQAFARLRTWDTAHNNGVLIYLLLADHAIEIVADRGLHGRSARRNGSGSAPTCARPARRSSGRSIAGCDRRGLQPDRRALSRFDAVRR